MQTHMYSTVNQLNQLSTEINVIIILPFQVFSRAKTYFSVGGNLFNGEPVHFSYMPDMVLEHARNVTIKLHHRIGRFLKLQLYFASRWILLSEISFDSGKYDLMLFLFLIYQQFAIIRVTYCFTNEPILQTIKRKH